MCVVREITLVAAMLFLAIEKKTWFYEERWMYFTAKHFGKVPQQSFAKQIREL